MIVSMCTYTWGLYHSFIYHLCMYSRGFPNYIFVCTSFVRGGRSCFSGILIPKSYTHVVPCCYTITQRKMIFTSDLLYLCNSDPRTWNDNLHDPYFLVQWKYSCNRTSIIVCGVESANNTLRTPTFYKIHQAPLKASGSNTVIRSWCVARCFAKCVAQGQWPREAKTEKILNFKTRVGELQNDPWVAWTVIQSSMLYSSVKEILRPVFCTDRLHSSSSRTHSPLYIVLQASKRHKFWDPRFIDGILRFPQLDMLPGTRIFRSWTELHRLL